MIKKITLKPHITRKSTHFPVNDERVPAALLNMKVEKPDLTGFPYPLPSAKKDYTCFAVSGNVTWYGAKTGLTRYDAGAEYDFDRVMFFSADRDLEDNDVKALLPEGDNVWVLTATAVTLVEMIVCSPEEISEMHLAETKKFVDRHGMVSQKHLEKARDLSSAFPHGHSDNDGGFTAKYNIGVIMRYACLKRDLGPDNPRTIQAKADAVRGVEACLLLMYIHGRGNGFVARTYLTKDEPVPDDGLFFRRSGNKATCLDTSFAREKGCVGVEIPCEGTVPERLRHLLTDEGYTEDDVIYKADTSSDEITLQMLCYVFAHKYLACDDPELDEIIKDAVKTNIGFIIDNGFYLADFSGEPTTWAKWNEEYFCTEDGYVDGALNSAELLFYLKAVMEITGEKGRWEETYNYLINERGYADMTEKHYDRMVQFAMATGAEYWEEIMYGDHMLATASFYVLCTLETDETLLGKYRRGYKSWRSSIAREHNPGYDFMYILACPDETIDPGRVVEWFARFNVSRLASSVSLVGRHDIPYTETANGYKQCSTLLPPDERFISKYDRNTLEYKNEDSGGKYCIESSYYYNYAYWMGRYFGIID